MNRRSRYSRKNRYGLKNEINITPFVDVMLVLLVIFMITAPMLISGIEVDLPKTKTAPLSGKEEPLTLTVDKKGYFYIEDIRFDERTLKAKMSAVFKERPDVRVFVRGDRNTVYGDIMRLFGLVKEVGIHNVALVTEVEKKRDSAEYKKSK